MSSIGTVAYYNGILFRDCELVEYDQVVEAEKSGTDPIYSRFRITLASSLVRITNSSGIGHPSSIAADGFATIDQARFVQRKLQEYRKDFWLAMNAQTDKSPEDNSPGEHVPADDDTSNDSFRSLLVAAGLSNKNLQALRDDPDADLGRIEVYPLPNMTATEMQVNRADVLDFDNGPKPIDVKIMRIAGGRFMRVQFTIEICRYLCEGQQGDDDSSIPPVRDAEKVEGVISNRWSVKESLDADWRSTITIEGVLRVSDQRYKLNAMRLMTSTRLIPYTRLTEREFFFSEDGLEMRYRYTMKESGPAPPPLTVDWDGKYSESVDNGAVVVTSVRCRVKGSAWPPNGWSLWEYKSWMLQALLRLIESRVTVDPDAANVLPGQKPRLHVIREFTVLESMNTPEMSADLVVMNASDPGFTDLTARWQNLGVPPTFDGYDARWWPIPAAVTWDNDSVNDDYGTQFEGYYHDPCSQWHGKPRGLNVDITDLVERNEDESIETTAYVYGGMESGAPNFAATAPNAFGFTSHHWSGEQLGGFTYISVESENLYEGDEGQMVLPLSYPRSTTNGTETIAVASVHAGVTMRRLTMVCRRQGAWPKLPKPAKTILPDSSGGPIETLVRSKVLPEAPKPEKDGVTKEYVVQCQFDYAQSREPVQLKVPRDQRIAPIAGDNLLAIADLYSQSELA